MYENHIEDDVTVAFDSALKQMICNVLDNALEASPRWLSMVAFCAEDNLVLEISDHGPGFPEAMLENLGRPYQSSKGKTGGGLGLFFVVNVARKLGGSVTAVNRNQTAAGGQAVGALVRLTLPLSAISLEAGDNTGASSMSTNSSDMNDVSESKDAAREDQPDAH